MIITDDDGETHSIVASGPISDAESVIEAHRFDPTDVEYTIKKGVRGRLNDLETATGSGGRSPKQGIVHRIDTLEDDVERIKDELGMN